MVSETSSSAGSNKSLRLNTCRTNNSETMDTHENLASNDVGSEEHGEVDWIDPQHHIHDPNDDPQYHYYEDDDWCNDCVLPLNLCFCGWCHHCLQKTSKCTCEKCVRGKPVNDQGCDCGSCPRCGETTTRCECDPCELCNEALIHCKCINMINMKVRFGERLLQRIPPPRPMPDGWEYPPAESVMLHGYLDDHHVFVVKKPSVLLNGLKRKLSSTLEPITTKVQDQASRVFKMTKDIWKPIVKWWNASKVRAAMRYCTNRIVLHFETEDEGTHINVTTKSRVRKMVTNLAILPRDGKTLALSFDCEAVNLGRDGKDCYIQIRDHIHGQTYLVDLMILGMTAWNTCGKDNTTDLKQLFEDRKLIKLIFGVSGDSDALYWHYGIKLAGVLDVQYLDLLSNRRYQNWRPRYTDSMKNAGCLNDEENNDWNLHKHYSFGRSSRGYDVFTDRPLPNELKMYAIGDVRYTDLLAKHWVQYLTARGIELAFQWTNFEIQRTWEEHPSRASRPGEVPVDFRTCWNVEINTLQLRVEEWNAS